MQSILPQDLLLSIFGDGSEYLWSFEAQEEEQEEQQVGEKKAVKKGDLAQSEYLKELSSMFFFPIEELEQSIINDRRSYEIPVDPAVSLDIAAHNLTEDGNQLRVLLRNSLIDQIVSRSQIQTKFCDSIKSFTKLNVYPTELGIREIDPFHFLYPCKYISNKPIGAYEEHQIMIIMEGVQSSLLYLDWSMDLSNLRSTWQSEFFNGLIDSDWNAERIEICEAAISKLGEIAKHKFIDNLKSEAIKYVSKECGKNLHELAHFQCPVSLDDESFILALGYDNRDLNGAVINKDGYLVDSFIFTSSDRGNAFRDRRVKTYDLVMSEFNIVGVVIGGQGINAKDALEFILSEGKFPYEKNTVSQSLPFFLTFVGDYFARIKKYARYEENVFVSPELPKNTKEESQYTEPEKYLVSLARYFINPTFEICSLFNKENDYLMLPLHPYQDQIPEDTLFEELHAVLKKIIETIGVDINYVLHRPHLHGVIQFIKGIHRSRAKDIIQTILASDDQVIYSRADLYVADSTESILTKEEFEVAAEVIRIGDSEIEYADPLDDMKINPSNYVIARKICSDAIEETEEEIDPQNLSRCVSKLTDDPDRQNKLKALELRSFASHLANAMNNANPQQISDLVEDIRTALIDRYEDQRPRLKKHSEETNKIFYYVTGETDNTFSINSHVYGELKNMSEKCCFFVLECGLCAKVDKSDIIDAYKRPQTFDIFDHLHSGFPMRLAIKNRHLELFQVTLDGALNLRTEQQDYYGENDGFGYENKGRRKILYHFYEVSVELDPFFGFNRRDVDLKKAKEVREKAQSNVRFSQNDKYKNLDFKSCCKYLRSEKNSWYCFRPSRSGENFVNLTWVIANNLFGNVELQQDSMHGYWTISEDPSARFENPENAVSQYVNRIQNFVSEMLKCGKFVAKNESQVRSMLDALAKKGKSVPYLVHFDYSKPTMCLISFKPTPESQIQQVSFKITSEGYLFQNMRYRGIVSVINDFKRLASGKPMLGQ
eukprot:NODE_5_length_72347_cov_1.339331.p1 type:complete len:999 gc:universal NODE_5_length_72347_cov_1.339331:28362-25366(-)